MNGPFVASLVGKEKHISYTGNRITAPTEDVSAHEISIADVERKVADIASEEKYLHLHLIDSAIFFAAIQYFSKIKAEWCNLPLTTLMISSPGEVYRGKRLNYTSDALPIDLKWFDESRKVFLSESSQFYLELRLLQSKIDRVFSIYNSFRKEKADFSHLTEFQHIEFEGKVSSSENIEIAVGLLDHITKYVCKNVPDSLLYFLSETDFKSREDAFDRGNFEYLSFKEALELLYADTGDLRYREFSLKHFGSWEEVRLTNILGKHAVVHEFPLLQIPFYHEELKRDENDISLSASADIILNGYREVIGSGERIKNHDALLEKAKYFNLPPEDYSPYIDMRKLDNYRKTAGFGLGWQRYTQWLLKMPFIWDVVHAPRTHFLPKP